MSQAVQSECLKVIKITLKSDTFKNIDLCCVCFSSVKQLFEMDQSKHLLLSFIGIAKSLSRNPLLISVVLPENETDLLRCFSNYTNEQDGSYR